MFFVPVMLYLSATVHSYATLFKFHSPYSNSHPCCPPLLLLKHHFDKHMTHCTDSGDPVKDTLRSGNPPLSVRGKENHQETGYWTSLHKKAFC